MCQRLVLALYKVRLSELGSNYVRPKQMGEFLRLFDQSYVNKEEKRGRDGSGRVAKFLSENNSFNIKSKIIKMLICKKFASLLDPSLESTRLSSIISYIFSTSFNLYISSQVLYKCTRLFKNWTSIYKVFF